MARFDMTNLRPSNSSLVWRNRELLSPDTILRRFLARNIGAEQRYGPLFATEIDRSVVRAPNEPRDASRRRADSLSDTLSI